MVIRTARQTTVTTGPYRLLSSARVSVQSSSERGRQWLGEWGGGGGRRGEGGGTEER